MRLWKTTNKFLALLPEKVWFVVWIDLLVKEKVANLSKNFLFFSFFSFFICFIFEFCILHFSFILYFFYKVLRILSIEEMNELFYSLQKECASQVAQIAPTWEDIVARQAQTSTSQQAYDFEGGESFQQQ